MACIHNVTVSDGSGIRCVDCGERITKTNPRLEDVPISMLTREDGSMSFYRAANGVHFIIADTYDYEKRIRELEAELASVLSQTADAYKAIQQDLTALAKLASALLADHAGYVTYAYWDGLPSQPPAPDQVPSLELRLKVFAAIRSAKEKLSK